MKSAKTIQLFVISLIIILLILVAAPYLPPGVDWELAFRPAANELLALRSPYNVEGFFNPAWTLIPVLPLALLPVELGRAAFLMLSLAGYAYGAYRLGGRNLPWIAFLTSPIVLHGLLNANFDWIPLLGFSLPPQIGLFLVLTKPQVGWVVALFWLVEAWRDGRWRQVATTFLPVTIAFLLNDAIFGFWPARYAAMPDLWWNASFWPMSIPVGLTLIVTAIRTRKIGYALAAGPCLSPYVLFHSWVGPLAAILRFPLETLAAVVGLWILVILRAISL